MAQQLVLKVDVDTYQGTLEGVPRLLDLFARHGIVTTFFFSLGPDNTGKAVKRVLRKGFVKKVLRASPAASYGIKTMLYGTLLPAPDIGTKPEAVARMREAHAAGHECGIHAWDHVDWHDRLPRMERDEISRTVRRTHERFAEIFGFRATVSAAPGWTATAASMEIEEENGIRVTSHTRGGSPFRPMRRDGSPSAIVELPSTLPTLDEAAGWDEFAGANRPKTTGYFRDLVLGPPQLHVHSIHTEIEGGKALGPLFFEHVAAWKAAGVEFLTLGQAAARLPAASLPCRELTFTTIRGRATPVAAGR